MAMQNYSPMRLAPNLDEGLRNDLLKVDRFLRQLTPFAARIPAAPQGTPGALGGNNLDNYLFLPGRAGGQFSRGRVTFQTKIVESGGVSQNNSQTGVGFTSYSPNDSPTTVNFSIEESAVGRTKVPTRDWVFPAFNDYVSGPTQGLHYFVDTSDYQTLTNKLFTNSNYYQLEDTVAGAGWLNAAHNRTLQFAWAGTFPLGGGTASDPFTLSGTIPSLQIPALDYKSTTSGARDRSHIWCILKSEHTDTTPFEAGGPVMGSSSGQELYAMQTSAKGALPAPSDGAVPVFRPTMSKSCDFVTSSITVTIASGTAGIYPGMRMRETLNGYALTEDTHVVSVPSSTTIVMSNVWSASNLTRTVEFFGMTWSSHSSSLLSIIGVAITTGSLAF